VPAKCVTVESSLTQKLRRGNVKLCRDMCKECTVSQRREKFGTKSVQGMHWDFTPLEC
jgi:hypothetical protein